MTAVTPYLMFQGDAEAAMRLYVSLFDDGELLVLDIYPEGQEPAGKVMHGAFRVGGQTVRCIDSPQVHDFTFTPATSLFVDCASEAEIDRLAVALGEGGRTFMPMADYGFSRRFAWISDRFGVSWQLNLL
jgi:predicted 3-demethylubiquinone-9 3-methyltransferase (glyoxalase superfamily)